MATCYYAGRPYREGSFTCQDGEQMRCTNNGVWSPTGEGCRCENLPSGAEQGGICFYAGGGYSEGSIMCQAGKRMRCTNNGVWSDMDQGCKC
jgi:hypothetical protein